MLQCAKYSSYILMTKLKYKSKVSPQWSVKHEDWRDCKVLTVVQLRSAFNVNNLSDIIVSSTRPDSRVIQIAINVMSF